MTTTYSGTMSDESVTTENSEVMYSVVIPVYNSSESLVEIVERTRRVFDEMHETSHEIIFVDDHSPEATTWETLKRLADNKEEVTAVRLTRNFGQQAATLCGIREARGEYIITMDDDLQHQPEHITKLVEKRGHDIVIGHFVKKKHSLFKTITSRIKGWFDHKLIGKPRHIQLSSFRLFHRRVADGILALETPYPFLPAMMFHVSQDVAAVTLPHSTRKYGKGGYGLSEMIGVFSNLLINNSSYLLRIIGKWGVLISSASVLYAAILIVRKLVWGVSIAGWTSLMVAVLIIGGMILFSQGVIGEYLLRIIRSSERRPTYLVREKRGRRHG